MILKVTPMKKAIINSASQLQQWVERWDYKLLACMVLEMEFWALHVVDKHGIYTSILGSYLLIFCCVLVLL